jgi:streptogramin lyase
MTRSRRALLVAACLIAMLAALSGAPDAAASFTVTEYPVLTPNSTPDFITLGSDGNLWFTEETSDQVARITPGGVVTEFPTATSHVQPSDITAGPDGNLWFTEPGANDIGRITTSGTITLFPVPQGFAQPFGITDGPDGRLWFTEHNISRIGRITTAGKFLGTFKLPSPTRPNDITAGPDGNLWFTELGGIGRITPTGTITEFPDGLSPSNAGGIVPGSDGNLWFTDGNSVLRTTTSGTITAFPVPTPSSGDEDIAPGPDGNLWYTENFTSQIGQITTSGVTLSETPTATAGSEPAGIWPGPDGNMWFAEQTDRVGRLALPNLNLRNVYYIPNKYFIPNIAKLGHQGDTVSWLMLAPGQRGIIDTTGLNLYGSDPAGGPVPTAIGGIFSYAFDWAGTFTYGDPFHTASRGRVSVPVLATHAVGAPETAALTWASVDPPAGDVFDVQVEVPGSASFVDWQTTTALGGSFGPSTTLWAGPGTYKFRSRLRNPGPAGASGYSAAKAITLS